MLLKTIFLISLIILREQAFAQQESDEDFLNIVWKTLVDVREPVHYLAPNKQVYFTPAGYNMANEQEILKRDLKDLLPPTNLKEIVDILYKDTVSEHWDTSRLHGTRWEIVFRPQLESGQINTRYIISKALFDRQQKYCLIFRIYDCGSECASGKYYLYRKEYGTWSLVKVITRWIS